MHFRLQCDGVRHCPNGEDELPVSCLFYRVVSYLNYTLHILHRILNWSFLHINMSFFFKVETHLLSVSQRLNSDESRQRGVPR